MAGERLVGHRVNEVGGANGQIRVDVDPRAEATVVPVVARPWLVRDEADLEILAVRDTEQGLGPGPEPPDEPLDDTRQLFHGDLEPPVPGGEAVGEWLRAGEEIVELGGGGVEVRIVAALRRPGKASGQVLDVRQLVAGQREGLGPEGGELGRQPTAALLVRNLGREPVDQRARRRRRGGRAIGAGRRRPRP